MMKAKSEKRKAKNTGFTLIEMMVSIVILSLLASIGIANYITTLRRARDNRRETDLEQIRQALEIYRSESPTNIYPSTTGDIGTSLAGLVPDYISVLPTDPKGEIYYYLPAADNRTYQLCGLLELETGSGCGGASCGGAVCNHEVVSP